MNKMDFLRNIKYKNSNLRADKISDGPHLRFNANSKILIKNINKQNNIENDENHLIVQNSKLINQECRIELERIKEIKDIQDLWIDLCVFNNYKLVFSEIVGSIKCKEILVDFINYELTKLQNIKEIITKIDREIHLREKSLLLLHNFENMSNSNTFSNKIISDISDTFENIRMVTMNIILNFEELRKNDFRNGNSQFNVNEERFAKFEKSNYLALNLKNDLDFLETSNISKNFKINQIINDPLLLSLSSLNANEKMNYFEVPLNCKVSDNSKKIQNILITESIYYYTNYSNQKFSCNMYYISSKNLQTQISKLSLTANNKGVNYVNYNEIKNNLGNNLDPIKFHKNRKYYKQSKINLHSKESDANLNEITTTFQFYFFNSSLKDIEYEFRTFLCELNEEQMLTFRVKSNIYEYSFGVYPKIIVIFQYNNYKKNKEIIGFSFINYEEMNLKLSLVIKALIIQNKLLSQDTYTKAVSELVEFLTRNIDFDYIYVELFYKREKDKFSLNNTIKDSFYNNKFKWKMLINAENERKLVLAYKNIYYDKNSEFKVFNFQNTLLISLATSKQILNNDLTNSSIKDNFEETEHILNLFLTVYCISEICNINNFKINNSKYNELKGNELFKNLACDLITTSKKNTQFLGQYNDKIKCKIPDLNLRCILELTNIYFKNISLLKLKFFQSHNVNYTRIFNEKIDVLYDKRKSNLSNVNPEDKFYLIQTNDINISIILYKDTFCGLNIYDTFDNKYNNLELLECKKDFNIYLPAFEVKFENIHLNPEIFSKLIFSTVNPTQNEPDKFNLLHLINVGMFEYPKSSSSNSQNFSLLPEHNDLVINDDFNLAFINFNILSHLSISSILIIPVKKENFKIEKVY